MTYGYGDHSFSAAPVEGAPPPLDLTYSFTGWGSVALGDEVNVTLGKA